MAYYFLLTQVLLELTKQEKTEETVLVFDVKHLGTEATVRTFNLAAVSYLKTISLDYYEIGGNVGENILCIFIVSESEIFFFSVLLKIQTLL